MARPLCPSSVSQQGHASFTCCVPNLFQQMAFVSMLLSNMVASLTVLPD